MQSLIDAVNRLNDARHADNARGDSFVPDRTDKAIDDVIALIKQHERPVDVPQLVTLLSHAFTDADREEIERLDNQEYAELALKLLRPYLKQQQPVSASGVRYVAVEIYDYKIRYEGKTIYTGNVSRLTPEQRDKIVNDHGAMQANITAKE